MIGVEQCTNRRRLSGFRTAKSSCPRPRGPRSRPFVNLEDYATISVSYAGQPYSAFDCGGIWSNHDEAKQGIDYPEPDWKTSRGHGDGVRNVEQWYQCCKGLTPVLLDDPDLFGYCSTQLFDTAQEQGRIYPLEQRPKFLVRRMDAVRTAVAAYGPQSR